MPPPEYNQYIAPVLGGLWHSIWLVWSKVWWFAAPLMAFFIAWDFWVFYIRFRFISAIKWTLLEIKIPKDILKTPKAMEQIFAAAHAPYSYGLRWAEKYIEGMVEYWMSFEVVGAAGESHFYLRLPTRFRNLMEAAIYGQYPGAEITEAEDYIPKMPSVLPNPTFEIFGSEMILKNMNCYPIRTYPMFEEAVEERRVDPIAPLMETMSKLKGDEQIWIQVLCRPTGDDWKKEGQAEIDKIMGKKPPEKKSAFPGLGFTLADAVRAPFEHPSTEVDKKKESGPDFSRLVLPPSERERLESIDKKTSKLGFQTTIRFVYIDKRDAFSRDNVAAVTGFFRQFNTQNLNMFRPDKTTMTAAVHGLFKPMRLNWRRRLIYEHYKFLLFNAHSPILNIEELATVYHFPITGVVTPSMERVESKKGSPPPTIPLLSE